MAHRIVWVHGIGQHRAGYSAGWERAFNTYLHLAHEEYIEVCWDTVFAGTRGPGARAMPGPRDIPLTPAEGAREAAVRADLTAILQARASALELSMPAARGLDGRGGPVEWSERYGDAPGARGFLPDWLAHPDAYLGDFTRYLVSGRVRGAVKERAKEQLRPLVAGGHSVAIVAHSWGTVVAYDSLLDLEVELPGLRIANLFTLGSPLWLVRRLLVDRSGRKPGQTATWINVHARGDLVGAFLKPAFRVDRDYAVSSMGDDAHGSYFVPGNEAVQGAIVARAVLG